MRPPGFGSALPAWMWPQTTTSVGVPHASVNTALVYEASGRRAAKKNASKCDIPSPSNQWPAAALSSQPPSTESAARRRYLWWPTARGHTHTHTHESEQMVFLVLFCFVVLFLWSARSRVSFSQEGPGGGAAHDQVPQRVSDEGKDGEISQSECKMKRRRDHSPVF